MASSTATTIEEATPVREDLDAKSISSLTTVQASNKVSPGDTVADISRNEDEEDISTRSYVSSDPGYRRQPAPPADEVFADASASDAGPPPPVANAFVDPAAADGQSNLTVSDDDELDPDLRAQVQAAHAAIRAAKKEQRKRRIQKYNAMSDEQGKMKKPRRDDDDDGGGDSKPPPAPAAGGGALAVK